MADRSTISQLIQIGVEATPGTPVAATRQLTSLSIEPSIKSDVKEFAPMGFKYNTIDVEGKEWVEASAKGIPSFNEIVYPLSSVLTATTPTLLGSGVYQWAYSPSSSTPDNPKTYTVEHGGPVRADQFANGIFSGYTFNFSRDAVDQSGTLVGQRLVDPFTMTTIAVNEVQSLTITGTPTGGTFTLTWNGQTTAPIAFNAAAAAVQTALTALPNIGAGNITVTGSALPTGPQTITFTGLLGGNTQALITATSTGLTGGSTPTATVTETTPGSNGQLPIQPMFGNQLDIYLDSSAAMLGTTKLTRAFTGQISLADRFNPFWPINTALSSWAGTVERKVRAEARLMVEADGSGMAFLTNFRAGSSMFMRVQATGPLIAGGFTYLFRWDVALKVRAPSAFRDEEGVYAIEWTFDIVHDPAWGRSQQVVVQNTTAAL